MAARGAGWGYPFKLQTINYNQGTGAGEYILSPCSFASRGDVKKREVGVVRTFVRNESVTTKQIVAFCSPLPLASTNSTLPALVPHQTHRWLLYLE